MPYILSPAVVVTETDNTVTVPSVSATTAAFAGDFSWGPCFESHLLSDESNLTNTYWKPNDRVAVDFFTVRNFLSYSSGCETVRVVNTTNANTALQGRNACSANSHGVQILNDVQYVNSYLNGELDSVYHAGNWVAAYPGVIGNSLEVYTCAMPNAYSRTLTGTLNVNSFSTSVIGTGTRFSSQVQAGDYLKLNGEIHQVSSIANNTSLVLADNHIAGARSGNTAIRYWQYYSEFNGAPGTSAYASERSSTYDEMHIVVTDKDGRWSGTSGTILEKFAFVSKASDAKNSDGTTNYYRDVIRTTSKYVRWGSHASTLTNAGVSLTSSGATIFGGSLLASSYPFRGGSDGATLTNSEYIRGYDLFADTESIDITLLLGGKADAVLAEYIVQDIAETRMDAVAFLSVPMTSVVNNAGNETTSCESFRDSLTASSRAFLDSNWKYQYDKWNDTYRWIPMNGDMAGLMARTANAKDPWWSPAGYNRGLIKDVVKLAWNPKRVYRDSLYRNSINPIITDKGSGPLLLGDKTMLDRPSSFGYINVRMLFIVLEKAISKATKYQLFEFNDVISQARFKNMVEPYLRDVASRRGIIRSQVICDDSNNTQEVINQGGFIGDIYILPNRSTQWVLLNFIAVNDTAIFTEKTVQF